MSGRILWISISALRMPSKLAQQASNAERLDEFRGLIGQLRAACNGCHEKYMKTN